MVIDRTAYPFINLAGLYIAWDSGTIRGKVTEDDYIKNMWDNLQEQIIITSEQMQGINVWLGTLTDGDLDTVCYGELDDRAALLETAPKLTNELLEFIFEIPELSH